MAQLTIDEAARQAALAAEAARDAAEKAQTYADQASLIAKARRQRRRRRRRHRPVRLPIHHLRARHVRRLFRRVVGDAGAPHAADVGHQRHLLGDRRRRRCSLSAPARWHRVRGIAAGFGFFALILASVNIFGGFLVTQRMLGMYQEEGRGRRMSPNLIALLYLVAGALFILALQRPVASPRLAPRQHPRHGRHGDRNLRPPCLPRRRPRLDRPDDPGRHRNRRRLGAVIARRIAMTPCRSSSPPFIRWSALPRFRGRRRALCARRPSASARPATSIAAAWSRCRSALRSAPSPSPARSSPSPSSRVSSPARRCVFRGQHSLNLALGILLVALIVAFVATAGHRPVLG